MRKLFTVTLLFTACFIFNAAKAQTGWQWAINSVHGNGEAWPIASDNMGHIYATGFGCTRIGADSLYGGLFVTKVDSAGNFIWSRGTKGASATDIGIATDVAGNVYVLAVYEYFTTALTVDTFTLSKFYNSAEYFLMKLTPDDSVVWAKNVTNNNGGPTYYYGGIGVDGAGNVYLTGVYNCAIDTVGDPSSSLILTNNSDINNYDAFVAKYDTSGNAVWAKSFGGKKNDFTYAIAVSQKGNVFVAGQYASDTMAIGGTNLVNPLYASYDMSFVAEFDSSGNLDWAKNISRKIGLSGIKTDRYENIYLAGYVDSFNVIANDTLTCTGLKDVFIAKYTNTGTAVWATSAGGSYTDVANNIDVDTCGNIWVCGAMGGGALAPGVAYSMNFQGTTISVPPSDVDPMFIAEYDNSGHYLTGRSLGGGGDDQSGIALDGKGNLYLCGDYEDSSLVIGNDTFVLPHSFGSPEYLFIAKYNYSDGICVNTAGVTKVAMPAPGINIYPNPATYECTISSDIAFPAGAKAEIFDVTGRLANTFGLSGNYAVFSVAGLAPGIYECRITASDRSVVVKKLVVMK